MLRMEIARCVTLVAYCVVLVTSQRTFSRSCDCEYTQDGRCAYTLLLPAGGGDKTVQCPTTQKPEISAEDTAQLREQMEQLMVNISALRHHSTDQSRMLNQLQSLVLTHQQSLSTLGGLVKNLPGEGGGEGGEGGQGPCLACEQLEDQLKSQKHALEGLQGLLMQAQTDINQLDTSYKNLGQVFQVDELMKLILVQQNRTSALERSLAEALVNISKAVAEKMQQIACYRRGLLVSGADVNITKDAITASSRFNDGHGAERGRIYTQAEDALKGAWCAGESRETEAQEEPNAPEEWLQFDLGKVKSVFGVVTKGRSDYGQWVTTYSLNYTTTDPTAAGSRWSSYSDVLGDKTIFNGNKDQNTAHVNMLWQPIRARYIRVIPLTSDSNKCMRADVIGCLDEH